MTLGLEPSVWTFIARVAAFRFGRGALIILMLRFASISRLLRLTEPVYESPGEHFPRPLRISLSIVVGQSESTALAAPRRRNVAAASHEEGADRAAGAHCRLKSWMCCPYVDRLSYMYVRRPGGRVSLAKNPLLMLKIPSSPL